MQNMYFVALIYCVYIHTGSMENDCFEIKLEMIYSEVRVVGVQPGLCFFNIEV